jgi:hypothetical protein
MATDFRCLIEALAVFRVDYLVIGGVALVLHGSARVTRDLDICYAREEKNFEALAGALAPYHAVLRGAPRDLPFRLDARTLRAGLNFTLSTDLGDIDLLGEVTGVGGYRELIGDAEWMELYGHRVAVMGLASLERAKRAAGRLRDLADLAEIVEIRKRRPAPG